jgi:hypothetical protein
MERAEGARGRGEEKMRGVAEGHRKKRSKVMFCNNNNILRTDVEMKGIEAGVKREQISCHESDSRRRPN